ncbi:hypothetical protein [Streptococcus suis]|uniref:hypothetical protein n=1 Tax=Streptococcus suis TaxID=1307 RepID=UPI001EFF2B26|nr:hypothetical protein [Streptococcus suis]MCG9871611.1 hypothetical protein [Streptococcus suis]MCG9918247.1 hypothetical protein [Streptococcus suis]MCG9924100.1 hypothetical protein [Streptococcus suis]MCG9928123.1 hypothetical protein [Streptococcus suis]MCG9934409.1 hypothetical protein [Streptococcus suis]
MDRVYAVKCLVKNEFEPSYENYSSYEEVTYLLPADVLVWEDEQVDKNKLADYLRGLVEDGYVNADGIWKQSRLFHIAGVQEMDDRVEFDGLAVEVYRWFYNFEHPVTEEEFLNLYYQVDKNKLADYLRGLVEDGYVNADGIWKQSRLFHIAGVQEMDDRVEFDGLAVEVYRWFYNFEHPVTEEEFLNLYYFDDLGR